MLRISDESYERVTEILEDIGYACVGIHHGIALTVMTQMVYDGSLAHCPFLAAMVESELREITLQNHRSALGTIWMLNAMK